MKNRVWVYSVQFQRPADGATVLVGGTYGSSLSGIELSQEIMRAVSERAVVLEGFKPDLAHMAFLCLTDVTERQ